ncbi:hypothetical protein SARC_09052, partial [Sphaeroforma arctica JP610]
VIELTDLEDDMVNPIDLCNKLNRLVLPEFGAQGMLVVFFLFSMSWIPLVINIPVAAYHGYLYSNGSWQYDPTTIFRDLRDKRFACLLKTVFYLCCFFYYLVMMIVTATKKDE